MRFHRIFALAVLSTAGLWAADRVTAYRAELSGPSGDVPGTLVMVGDQMVFVDADRPDMSFSIPRSDVRSVTIRDNGTVVCETAAPYEGPFGSASRVALRLTDPGYADRVVHWIGVPVSGAYPRTDTQDLGARQEPGTAEFDVRRDDDPGRLVVTPAGLEFVDLKDRSHSRRWTYSELKGIERKNGDTIVVHPYSGDNVKFKTTRMMDDAIYNAIADRIVAARRER